MRHAEGPEGDFLRLAGLDKKWVTSSGYLHCVSASGKLLGGKASSEVLAAFHALPASERAPGAISVPALPTAQQCIPSPPENGLVLRVHARFLHAEPDGHLRAATVRDFPLMQNDQKRQALWEKFMHPNTEYLWLTEPEWRALIPEAAVGASVPVEPYILQRMARFHLTPKRATTSEGGIVHPKHIRRAEAHIRVTQVTDTALELHLAGFVHWGTDFDATKATSPNGPLDMGFASPLQGRIRVDRATGRFTRFDLLAAGHTWGRWGDANRKSMPVERPGKAPFGFAFELADRQSPTDRIPPGGNGRYVDGTRGYFAKQH